MKYVKMDGVGDSEVMSLAEMESPTPGAGEVLIDVAFAGVNRPDVLQRQGNYPPPSDASPILGLEVSGRVVSLGEGVTDIAVGDDVCALVNGGGYAEQVLAPAGQCLPIPRGLSLSQAAALPETFFTVYSNVFMRGQLKPDEYLLIHGGASGIGSTAIQMATALGSRVIVTVGSQEKCDACVALGAVAAINYHEQDFVENVKALTDGHGADVILDMVGGDYIGRNIKAAAMDGRIVNIAYLRGSRADVNFMAVMLKRLTLTGSTLRPRSTAFKTDVANQLQKTIWPLIEAGKISPKIDRILPISQIREAHDLLESNTVVGKLVLSVNNTVSS